MPPTVVTRVFALLGDPVAHSLSPTFQNAAFGAEGLDAVYVALRCTCADVPGLLAGLARAGGGGNVTVPHKTIAAGLIEVATPAVEATGACNTFWFQDERIHGDNTDIEGARAAVHQLLDSAAVRRCLLIGSGGAAAAVAVALMQEGAREIVIANRSTDRARDLIERLRRLDGETALTIADAPAHGSYDLVVNATPLGLDDADPLPVDLSTISARAALDTVYAPHATRWVRHARRLGMPATDGTTMLLAQGAAAFERWWRRPAPLAVMRAALAAHRFVPNPHGDAPPAPPS